MTLEQYVAELNGMAFWSEFSFSNNKFSPQAGQELELADSIVWLGRFLIALQLKERTAESDDPEVERRWFDDKVIKKGTKQIRDTLRYLDENEKIGVTNQRSDCFEITKSQIDEILKIVVFLGGKSLPEECWQTRHHISRTAGFIHVVAAHDYFGILEKLRVPEDIRRYFEYRQRILLAGIAAQHAVTEADIVGGFISGQDRPDENSREALRWFLQDTSGREGEELRVRGLQQLTGAAMYDAKMSKGVGLVISRDGEFFQLDWCFIELPWEQNADMERLLTENNPFRAAREKDLPSFLFKSK